MVREINLQIINKCNLKCKWCARSWLDNDTLKLRESEYMTWNTFTYVVDECHDYGITHFDLTPMMGELLLDTKLFQRLDYLKNLGKSFSFTTNLIGVPKTLPIIRKLLGYEKLHLGISIYGHDRESYKENTGADLFFEFSTNMQSIFKCFQRDGASIEFFFRYPMTYDEYPDGIIQTILRLLQSKYYGDGVQINEKEQYNFNWGGLIPYGKLDTLLGPIQKRGICPTAGSGTILHNGDFALCYMNDAYRKTVIANIYHKTLKEIYESDEYNEVLLDQQKGKYTGICKMCNERWWEYDKGYSSIASR